MGEKIGIFVRISDVKLWEEFKSFVFAKHHRLHSSLGMELENAMRVYLGRKPVDDPPKRRKTMNSRTIANLKKITNHIISDQRKHILQSEVEQLITLTAGGEWRTRRRYLSLLLEYGVLQPIRKANLKTAKRKGDVIFAVNLEAANKLLLL